MYPKDGIKGLFQSFFEWFMNIAFINILWLLFNLPIAYLVVTLLWTNEISVIITLSVTILVLIPVLFFPSTIAMFSEIRKIVMETNEKNIPLSFIHSFKKNYLRSMVNGFLILFIWLIFIIDYYFFTWQISESLKYVFFFLAILLLAFTLNYICFNVHFSSGIFHALKSSFKITIATPINSFVIAMTALVFFYISFVHVHVFIVFLTGSLTAFLTFRMFYQLYRKVSNNTVNEYNT